MDTRHTRPRLDAFLDGELDEVERCEVERHLAGCTACREEVESMRSIAGLLADETAPLPAGFVRATCARAIGSHATSPLWWVALPLPWRVGVAALLALAVLAGDRLGRVVARPSPATQLAASLSDPGGDAITLAMQRAEAGR